MSWHYLRVEEEESLQDICSDGEPLQPLKSKITHAEFYCNGKLMDSYLDSLSGMTFAHSMEILGEEKSMLSLEDSHVKISALQEKELDLMEKGLDFGEKWQGSFAKYDQISSSWKTHQCSLLGDLDEFSETWPQWGLMRDGECWEQQMLERHIRGTGYGLSPNGVDSFHTPNTTGLDGGSNSRKALKKRIDKWPTPTSSDWMSPKQNGIELKNNRFVRTSLTTGVKFGAKLSDAVNLEMKKNWPTPQVSDSKDRGNLSNPSIQRRMEIGKQVNLQMCVSQTSGQLNPMWVEWLMGWPQGWTELKLSEMDKSLSVQQQLGES